MLQLSETFEVYVGKDWGGVEDSGFIKKLETLYSVFRNLYCICFDGYVTIATKHIFS